jgi:hypothetical protein
MRQLAEFSNNQNIATIKSDGGKYIVEMYTNKELIDTKIFNEHTLRIVENFAKAWIHNEETK